MKKIHEERNWKSLSLKYEIWDDRIRIQTLLLFYWFDIPFSNIEKVEIGNPPVVWDIIKKGYIISPRHWFGMRILKNDLADLSLHITIEKKKGIWKQIRITPKDPEKFRNILLSAMKG